MSQIGIAVLGAGRWGAHLVRNFLEHPQARLAAVIDPNRDRLMALKQQLNFSDDVSLVADLSEIPNPPEVSAVAIATPATTHYDLITTALKRGYHVLAEKPLTLDPNESLALCQLAEQQQRQLVIDHTYLFHPAVQQGQALVSSKTLGQLRYGYASRTHLGPVRSDVDALWDLAIHDIAIFNTWLQATPIQVQAQGQVWLQPDASDANYFPHGLSDVVWVTLTYPQGIEVRVHLCWLNPDKQRRLALVGSQGTLIFDELAASPLTLQRGQLQAVPSELDGQPTLYLPTQQATEAVALEPAEPLRQVCDHFLTCVQQQMPSLVSSGWVGAELVQILNGLTTSLNQGGQPVAIVSDRLS